MPVIGPILSEASERAARKTETRVSGRVLAAGFSAAMTIAVLGIDVARAVGLVPHRAVYDMVLGEVRSGGGVSSLSGRMVFEITGSQCNGYSQEWRYVTRAIDGEGTVSINDQRSSSWEDGEGRQLKFESTNFRDKKLISRVAGRAERSADKTRIKVSLTEPKKRVVTLNTVAMFPIQHSVATIEAAQAGKRLFATEFYDGSENGDKIYNVSTLIGKAMPAAFNAKLAKVPSVQKLDKVPAWPVAVSYFDRESGKGDQVPTYEVGFVFFQNGVSRRLVLDHGGFTIKGELKKIEFLETQPCKGQTSKPR